MRYLWINNVLFTWKLLKAKWAKEKYYTQKKFKDHAHPWSKSAWARLWVIHKSSLKNAAKIVGLYSDVKIMC